MNARRADNPGPNFGNPLQDIQTISQVKSGDREQFVADAKVGNADLTSDLSRDLITRTNYQDRLKIKEEQSSKGNTKLQQSNQLGSSMGGSDSNINY